MSLVASAKQRLKGYVKRLLGREPARGPEQLRNKHLWSIGVYSGRSPLDLAPDVRYKNPVITRDHVTDVSAGFVADPFLIRSGDVWHMFFEVFNLRGRRGEVGVATSRDLSNWNYHQIVLAEPFHLSYPFVFEWMGEHYMIPETHQTRTIRLYRAEVFPTKWAFVHTLMSGTRYADTTVFRHDDRWWLFTETNPEAKHDTLRLFHADDLFGQWTEHPASPIVMGDPHTARPGGSVVSTPAGLIRYAQDCAPRYGLSVNAFEITTLTTTDYAEVPVQRNPVLSASGDGWNAAGMHHVDPHELASGRWIAAVDGWYAATAAHVTRGS